MKKRRPLSKKQSKKIFRKTAQKVKPRNYRHVYMRGGIRL